MKRTYNAPVRNTIHCAFLIRGLIHTSGNEKAISIGSGLDNVTCSATFYLNTVTGSCRPRCGQWEGYPHAKQVISDAIIGTAACIGIAVTLFIIVLACVRDRNMYVRHCFLITFGFTTYFACIPESGSSSHL